MRRGEWGNFGISSREQGAIMDTGHKRGGRGQL
jgi:hypothetical protein